MNPKSRRGASSDTIAEPQRSTPGAQRARSNERTRVGPWAKHSPGAAVCDVRNRKIALGPPQSSLPGDCPALPCPALPCPALPCPALPCPALPCPALPCPALPCPALPCPAPCPASRPWPRQRVFFSVRLQAKIRCFCSSPQQCTESPKRPWPRQSLPSTF